MTLARVIHLHGDLDLWQRAYVSRELRRIQGMAPGTAALVDVSGVGYVDSTLVNALCIARNRLRDRNRICVVAPRSSFVWSLLAMTHLERTFPTFESISDACRFVEFAHRAGMVQL